MSITISGETQLAEKFEEAKHDYDEIDESAPITAEQAKILSTPAD